LSTRKVLLILLKESRIIKSYGSAEQIDNGDEGKLAEYLIKLNDILVDYER
jgi:hypothetical protein